jgi:tripartite-type tricarboxylate transporter receptor subunit TctC
VQTLPEMLATARRDPGGLAVAIGGSSNRAVVEMLQLLAGTRFNIVPYRGSAPAINAVLARDVSVLIGDVASVVPFLADNRMRGIAVTTAQRSPHLPNVPTIRESGVPEMVATQWFAIFAPKGVPQPVMQRLNTAFNNAAALPAMRTRLAQALSADPAGLTLEQNATFFREELARWKDVMVRAGVPQE